MSGLKHGTQAGGNRQLLAPALDAVYDTDENKRQGGFIHEHV